MKQKIPQMASIPTEEAVAAERERLQHQKRYRQTLRTTVYALVVVAAVAVLIATMFLPVLQVSGSSMEPTLEDGDVIVLVKDRRLRNRRPGGFLLPKQAAPQAGHRRAGGHCLSERMENFFQREISNEKSVVKMVAETVKTVSKAHTYAPVLPEEISENIRSHRYYEQIKRFFDIVCSLTALVVLAVPMLLLCVIVFLDDPHGSPIFSQTRIGKDGKPFRFYKFRSMYTDSEARLEELLAQNEMDGPVFKMKNDPRITRVGRFIRRCSIDELPQLFNILRGDMSIVGPRPALPREVEQYTERQQARLCVLPGLTCLWQVQDDRNSLSFEEWMELDLQYIRERSLWLDLRLILRTARAVVRMSGE
ncbi:MAG: sugar transferase [Clostridiales bacterium]|nr:sugar transferase [Clostridiales bacterium]